MLRVNEFQFYDLAVHVHPLTEVTGETKFSSIWLTWRSAAEKLNSIFSQRSLEFCLEAATELYLAIGNVVPLDFQEAVKKLHGLPDPEPEIGWGPFIPLSEQRNGSKPFLQLSSPILTPIGFPQGVLTKPQRC